MTLPSWLRIVEEIHRPGMGAALQFQPGRAVTEAHNQEPSCVGTVNLADPACPLPSARPAPRVLRVGGLLAGLTPFMRGVRSTCSSLARRPHQCWWRPVRPRRKVMLDTTDPTFYR